MAEPGPIHAVYQWVDDTFPGYRELLSRYAGTAQDRKSNRTRDNLDTLRYGLRALHMYAPWVRHVYIVSCAPQRPRWLAADTPGLTVVHHDAFMDRTILPTFNSFAIQSFLHEIPGLSRRFLQFDDDVLLSAAVTPDDFADASGRVRVFQRIGHTPPAAKRDVPLPSPWNLSLAHCNWLLDQAFGHADRPTFTHAPLLIDREWWSEMIARWPDDFAHTRASRFRACHNVVPDYLYPHFLLGTGRGVQASVRETYRRTFYFGLEDYLLHFWSMRALLAVRRPQSICFNDNFGDDPNSRVVARVRHLLENRYPIKSPFER